MTAAVIRADLEAKPAALRALADRLGAGNPFAAVPSEAIRRVVLVGMGSSRYAAGVAALELRAAGIDAVGEYASAAIGHPPGRDTLVVAISASGESSETLVSELIAASCGSAASPRGSRRARPAPEPASRRAPRSMIVRT